MLQTVPPFFSRQLLPATLLLLAICACEKNDTSYFPLDENLRWQYNIEKRTVEGSTQIKDIVQNMGQTDSDVEDLYLFQSVSGTKFKVRHSKELVELHEQLSANDKGKAHGSGPTIILTYPLKPGSSWKSRLTTSTIATHDRKAGEVIESIPVSVSIESLEDTVSVAAGKYRNCMKVVSKGEKLIQKGTYAYHDTMTITINNIRWYAPGVGLVKEEHLESSSVLEYPESGYTKTLDKFTRP